MIDTATGPVSETSVAWLAIHALGLAYSDNSQHARLGALLEAARDRPELLEAVHRRLDGVAVAERSMRDDALRLLDRAKIRVGSGSPPPPGR